MEYQSVFSHFYFLNVILLTRFYHRTILLSFQSVIHTSTSLTGRFRF